MNQEELIDKYDILNGKHFEIREITQMMNKYHLNEQETDILNKQIIEWYCKKVRIDTNYDINAEFQNDKYKETVAMWLTYNGCLVPKQWMHNYDIKNIVGRNLKELMFKNNMPMPNEWQDEQKMSIFDKAYFGIVSDIKGCKADEQDDQGFTLAMLLVYNNITVPKELQHDPYIKNKYGQTIFDIYARTQQQPPEWTYKKADYQDKDGYTQAMMLAKNKLDIPKCFYHDPSILNNDGQTVAMIQAMQGKVPDKQWIHDRYLRPTFASYYNQYYHQRQLADYYTVQNILQSQNIDIPEEWKYEPLDEVEDNQAMIDAYDGIIPELGNNNPEYQNLCGETVPMILAKQGIMPPREWMHDYDIENMYERTLKYQLQNNGLPVPYHWHDNDMTIFDKACYGIIPDIEGHQPDEQNEGGQTIAMILALQDIEIPKEWQINTLLQDNEGNTIAMYQAMKGKTPDKCWEHDSKIQNKNGDTVAMLQARKGKIPDKQWEHKSDLQDGNGYTVAMYLVSREIIPPQQWYHEPSLKNKRDDTVAMIYAINGIIPPKEWQHNTLLKDNLGNTVAMILADHYIIPPKEWLHDPMVQNKGSWTVAMYLAKDGFVPPEYWMHDVNYQDRHGETIKSQLQRFGYIYKNNQFILRCKTQILNDKCQKCQIQDEYEFVKTKCGHKICEECFKELYISKESDKCPICKQENWYEVNSE